MGRVAVVCKNIGIGAIVAAMPLFAGALAARAETLTAGVALDIMPGREFSAYTQGIIEGIAQARYEAEGGTTGMQCIYEWYYGGGDESLRAVIAGFERFPDHSPGAVMSGLIQKECPR